MALRAALRQKRAAPQRKVQGRLLRYFPLLVNYDFPLAHDLNTASIAASQSQGRPHHEGMYPYHGDLLSRPAWSTGHLKGR